MLEIQQKTESPQTKQEELKQEETGTMHEVEQNKVFFKRESEENAMNQGCLKKILSAKATNSTRNVLMLTKNKTLFDYASCITNSKAYVILSSVKKTDTIVCFLEKEVVRQYVDTYSR